LASVFSDRLQFEPVDADAQPTLIIANAVCEEIGAPEFENA
jgi:hypothetical protein